MAYKRIIASLQSIRENYLQNIKIITTEEMRDRLEWTILMLYIPVMFLFVAIIYKGVVWIMK